MRWGAAVLAAVVAASSPAAGQESAPSLPELRWLAPNVDPVAALTTEPTECLGPATSPEEHRSQKVGRALFRTPTLLGGQAARAGLSCDSCHRNGRDNPDFAFAGVSGAPGTADVTSSVFSSHRGDGVDNPVVIPDLAGPRALLKVDRSPGSGALEAFIRGLIVEEFDGPEPPAQARDALAAYVRGLAPEACPDEARRPIRVADAIADVREALALAHDAIAGDDRATARLLIAAARSGLQRIDVRYRGEEHAALRLALARSARLLGDAQLRLDEDDASGGARILTDWSAGFGTLAAELEAQESASLFNPNVLSSALAEPR